MARYIDAEPLENILKNEYKDIVAGRYPFNIVVWDIVRILEEQPTADVVEVVHGEWDILTDEYDCEYVRCSACNEEFYPMDEDTVDRLYNYCPECGAKMNGKKVE